MKNKNRKSIIFGVREEHENHRNTKIARIFEQKNKEVKKHEMLAKVDQLEYLIIFRMFPKYEYDL